MNRFLRSALWSVGLLSAALTLSSCSTIAAGRLRPGGFTTVVIDAGHGGKDNGETPNQLLQEKVVALDTAKRLQRLLDDSGLHTVMTRTQDVFVELDERVRIADRYYPNAILVSIHYNASPSSSPRGLETFFWRTDSYGLATRVQRHLVGETGLDNRGVTRRVLRLTHNPQVPAILCECGFLTNRAEANIVSTEAYRQKAAQGIADGVLEEQENGDVNIGSLPPINRPVYTRPSRVHHTGSSHRQRMAKVEKARAREHAKKARGKKTAKSAPTKKTKKKQQSHQSSDNN